MKIIMNMKKILFSIFAIALALPVAASAATFSFSPSAGSFAPGDTFSVGIYINPATGEKITTAKLSASFPANLVEVVSFSQAAGWMPLVAPGFDLIDNTNGKLVKTGGFPARVTALKLFGTIVFKAKKAGTAVIGIEGDSMALDTANANKYTTSTGAAYTIKAAALKVKHTPTVKHKTTSTSGAVKTQKSNEHSSSLEKSSTEEATTTATTTDSAATSTAQGQTAAAGGTNANNIWYYILAAVAILAGAFAWRKWGKKS